MITVKRFKEIINSCPDNWTIIFRKWEHMSPTPDGSYKGYKGFRNIVGVKIVDIFDRITFDLTQSRGRAIATLVNGREAQFTEVLSHGDKVDLYWKEN